jgi:hypothetical protein
MNCQEFWNSLPETAHAHPHLEKCADCSTRMKQRRELAAGMRALAEGMQREEAPARVEARLRAAFRAQAGMESLPSARRRWVPAFAWAAAMAAMLVAGVLLVRDRQPEAKRPSPVRTIELARAENAGAMDVALEDGFLPLPGAAHLPAVDDVDVVHVELPRSAMMQVGIEVSEEQAGETVQADVMVGSDGLARAVRFTDVTGSD